MKKKTDPFADVVEFIQENAQHDSLKIDGATNC